MRCRAIPKSLPLCIVVCVMFVMCSSCSTGEKSQVQYNSIEMTLHVDRSRVRANEPVTVTYSLENVGSQVQIINSPDTPAVDIIASGNGKIYAALSAAHPELIVHRLELQPGEIKTIQFIWELKPEDALSGTSAAVSGLIYDNSQQVQTVGVSLCINYC